MLSHELAKVAFTLREQFFSFYFSFRLLKAAALQNSVANVVKISD